MKNDSKTLAQLKAEAREEQQQIREKKEYTQLVVFTLHNEKYALPISQVKEIVACPEIAIVPHAETYILGAANIRGEIIAIIDLAKKFELTKGTLKSNGTYVLVIADINYKVGVILEEVPHTMLVDVINIDESKDVLKFSALKEECIKGVVNIKGSLILLLDVIKMLELDELKDISKL